MREAAFIFGIFVLLFFAFLLTSNRGISKRKAALGCSLNPQWYSNEAPREPLIKEMVILDNCWTCHAMWVGMPTEVGMRFAHPEVKNKHGIGCFSCHREDNRNLLVGMEHSGIMKSQVARLCGRCHGPYYRAWLEGRHGLKRGRWRVSGPFDVEIKQCNECHDPHSPKYKLPEHLKTPPPVNRFRREVCLR